MAGQTHFKLLGPVLNIGTRDFALADTDLANPQETDALNAGEWITLNSDYKAIRAGNVDAVNEETKACFPVFYDKGDYSVQALKRVPVLFSYAKLEVETTYYTGTPAVGASMGVLQVAAFDGTQRSVLSEVVAGGTDTIVGVVTKAASAGEPIRVLLG